MLSRMDDVCELEIETLAHDGRGIGRLKDPEHPGERGLTVFVAGALPGAVVRCRIVSRKPRFAEAECLEVVRPAPDAVAPLCPHTGCNGLGACGGCPLQTMPYNRQLEWKTRLARDALVRIGGLDADLLSQAWTGTVPSPRVTAFRNRMTFAFGTSGGRLVLGQRSRGDAAVLPTPGCALLPQGAQMLLAEAQAAAAESGLAAWRAPERRHGSGTRGTGFWRFLTLRQGWLRGEEAPRWWAVCLTSPGGPRERAAVRTLAERLLGVGGASRLGGFIHEERSREDALAAGERRILCLNAQGAEDPAAGTLHLPLGGRHFALDAASFFQVNTDAADLLAHMVMEMAPQTSGGSLLDIYCGVGAPGQLLAARYTAVLGMENDRRAVAMAGRNADAAGLGGCHYVVGDAGALLGRVAGRKPLAGLSGLGLPQRWDMALVDPPRGGLAPRALDSLLKLAPEYLLYVSCNPATLARDAARLSTRYSLQRMGAVDLFPHTPHLECCSLWHRR